MYKRQEEIFTGKSLTGVILSLDAENEKATVYTAADGQEKEFALSGVELITDSYGNKIGFSSLKVGQVVDVSYKEGNTSQVEPVSYTHLDVYKRQYLYSRGARDPDGRGCGAGEGVTVGRVAARYCEAGMQNGGRRGPGSFLGTSVKRGPNGGGDSEEAKIRQ